jgi:hypothetical protein
MVRPWVDVQEDEPEGEEQPSDGGSPEDTGSSRIERYCAAVEGNSAWGGQLELQALACALKRAIRVYSVDMDVLDIGSEFAGKGPWSSIMNPYSPVACCCCCLCLHRAKLSHSSTSASKVHGCFDYKRCLPLGCAVIATFHDSSPCYP